MRNGWALVLLASTLAACHHASQHGTGGPGQPGDGTPDAGLPASCKGKEIDSSGTLDVDLKAITVTGTITVNGQTLPAGARGAIVFADSTSGNTATTPIATNGAATYGLALAPGTYDVTYAGDPNACSQGGVVPCNAAVVKTKVTLSTSGSLDLDVTAVQVTGHVTINGAAFPTGGQGAVTFASHVTTTSASATPIAQDGSYSTVLVAGTYDAGFGGDNGQCGNTGAVPCNQGVIKPSVSLTTSGSLDLDVKSVMVTGAVTLNGQPFPSGSSGSVGFATAGTTAGTKAGSGVLIDGTSHYALTLVAGTYDVSYGSDPSSCNTAGQAPVVPCNSGHIKTSVGIMSSGELDLDVKAVGVSGSVTLNEQPFPTTNGDEGIAFRSSDQTGGDAFARLGGGTYATMLLAGTYDVVYGAASGNCTASAQTPCNDGVLKSKMSFTTTGALDLDVKAVTVNGKVTLNGAPIPMVSSRGSILFTSTSAGSTSLAVDLGADADATYSAMLVAGSYDVGYAGDEAGCKGPTAPTIPCNGATVKSGVSLTTSGALDLDVPTVQVSGTLTLNGADFPSTFPDRGSILWRSLDGASTSGWLSPAGSATYDVTLVAGRYVIEYADDTPSCTADDASFCGSELLVGCN